MNHGDTDTANAGLPDRVRRLFAVRRVGSTFLDDAGATVMTADTPPPQSRDGQDAR